MKIAIATLCILAPAMAGAVATPIENVQEPAYPAPLLGPVALNAAANARYTKVISVLGRTQITVYIEYDAGVAAAATHITLECWAGRTAKKMAPVPILYDNATVGTSDVIAHKWRWAVAATSQVLRAIVTPLNDNFAQCLIGSEGVVIGTDIITRVDYRLGRL